MDVSFTLVVPKPPQSFTTTTGMRVKLSALSEDQIKAAADEWRDKLIALHAEMVEANDAKAPEPEAEPESEALPPPS